MIRWRSIVRRKGFRGSGDDRTENPQNGDATGGEYRQFFELCPDPSWIFEPESRRILAANRASVSCYGYSHDELLGMTIDELRPAEERPRLHRVVQGLPSGPHRSTPWQHRRKDGTLFDVEIASDSVTFRGRSARLVVAHDITERLRVERDLDRMGKAYRMLAHLAFLHTRSDDEQSFLTGACRVAVEEGGYAMAWIGYARESFDRRIEPMAVYGDSPDYVSDLLVSWDADRPEGRGPTGVAVRERRAVLVEDLRLSDQFSPWRERAQARGYISSVALPLKDSARVYGAVSLYAKEAQAFDKTWFSVLERVADELLRGIVQIRRQRNLNALNVAVSHVAALASGRNVQETTAKILQATVETLGADLGVVSCLETGEGRAPTHILAVWGPSLCVGPGDIFFEPSLCEPIPQDDTIVFRRSRIRLATPHATFLEKELSWTCRPIMGASGRPVGHLSLCYAVPPDDTGIIAPGLLLFASRLASEFERAELERKELLTAQLLEKVRNAVVAWNGERQIAVWNPGTTEIYGWAKEEALGKGPELLVPDTKQLHALLTGVESEGRWRGRTDAVTKTGEKRVVELGVSFVAGKDDAPPLTVAVGTDVTSQVRLEEELRHAERLEVIGQLTGGVAHDFNNLLTVILGNSELLVEALGDQPKSRELADTVRRAAQRGADLTQHLLAFARKQPLKPQSVSVNAVLSSWDGLIKRTLGSRVEVELIQGAGLWEVLIDPGQLEVALLNLCLNARDAMPEGGRLTIEATNVWIDRNYADQYADVRPGQYVLVAVSDTGTGIRPEDLPRVFEPFFTTKEPGKGTGLGLSMVYGFIKQSQGHIKVYSELKRGTTIKMYLPKSGQSEHERPQLPSSASPLPLRATILLVEDNDMVRRFAREQLIEVGYRVLEASNAAEALEWLHDAPPIDLLFVDIVMPGGMNGKQLAEVVSRRLPGVRVLYTSGYTENAIIHQGKLDPGAHLLNKPYTRADLLRMIRAVFAEDTTHEQHR